MAVKIKLMRLGKIRTPQYRIVVADARTKREGRCIETIGKYHPMQDPSFIEVDSQRAQYWLGVGAQPTEPVRAILRVTGDWQKFKGDPGSEGTLRHAAAKADKRSAYDALAKAAMELAEKETSKPKKSTKAEKADKAEKAEQPETDKKAKADKSDTAQEPSAAQAATPDQATEDKPAQDKADQQAPVDEADASADAK